MMNHSTCDHEATSSARSRCRRGAGAPTTPRAPRAPREDEEKRPADPSRCCTNCRLRIIEWRGTDLVSRINMLVCDKCRYLLDRDTAIEEIEV